ncbi:bifunctional demethylmenaquinone methyltransferase/2-methoxy-6-polyprenyl-1,4-benzoquinol methylase UbiE [Helicobacter pylori]|uniref:bifunctional demethylmenaquinone methyltransferase/2-methoxy-6-polyprenyl-1,4-benzoquinol methylase UbiE n=1 Tax=Helicobacter pylori TaxID=210 RepID=UPI000D3329FE|nr:bifunctional demethylmenaquinone methyltransferase/2-methoxy-6-polyprenyl-1,4-benzoquinol methylase UbiE [Helicobacter pylori]PUD02113.1 bifunctional demethylmenaquinone methyltransferase/2-methoxy-6-polyprenyl-1,4-benzoquinol methylase UbiE [Helicobacter pylori]WQX17818.1 bifunctional demethylmenaquinone methyltransferase/2-methoxy-6-polyprenyl-1,4-benzoquinol methylase UbiE [Helicobacter pylori]
MKKEKRLKQEKIINMFDDIASSYDQANRLMSFGLDVKWRERACEHAFLFLENKKALRLVDVACGTGDMLVAWQKSALNCAIEFKECLGIDPSNNMLALAEKKLENKASFIQAQAKDLKGVGNNSVDILSIAYGLRNIVERQEALKEFFRVLKPRGVLVILEFLKKDNPTWLDKISGFYTNKVLPLVGGAISKNYGAYSYLPQSIEGFLSLEGLKHELKSAGFEILRTQDSIAQISTTMLVRKS